MTTAWIRYRDELGKTEVVKLEFPFSIYREQLEVGAPKVLKILYGSDAEAFTVEDVGVNVPESITLPLPPEGLR